MIWQNSKIHSLIKSKRFLLITMLCVTLSAIPIQTFGVAFDDFRVEPEKIEIVTSVSDDEEANYRTLFIFSTNEIPEVSGFATDLTEANNNQLAIPSDKVSLEPVQFDLESSLPQKVRVSFDLSEVNAGNYKGKIIFVSPPDKVVEVPITLEISESFLIPLIPLVLGVAANFTLKYTKKMISIKDSAENKFKETLELFDRHRSTPGSKWNTLIGNAYNKLKAAREFRTDGRYDKALEKLESAKKDLEEGAGMPEEEYIGDDPEQFTDLEDVKISKFLKGMAKTRDVWVFFGLTITLGISVISIWQTYVTETSAFGSSPFDYIAAFLFAFASQALLGEAIDLATTR